MVLFDTSSPPTRSPLSSDVEYPSVLAVDSVPPFSGTSLDKRKANWIRWKEDMHISMVLNGLWAYTRHDSDGVIKKGSDRPDPVVEPRAAANWDHNDRKACAYITSALTPAERRAIGPLPRMYAKAYWAALKERHERGSAVDQILLIREALALVARPGDNVPKVLDDAWELGERIHAMGDISVDVFKMVLALNTLREHQELLLPLIGLMKEMDCECGDSQGLQRMLSAVRSHLCQSVDESLGRFG